MSCTYCKEEIYIPTKYGEFSTILHGQELHISDDYGHEDTLKINFCPMCGCKLDYQQG